MELRSGARREPNTKATTIELYDGLEAKTQNAWPSVHFDLRRVNALFSPVIGAGFYYKTFMWPASFWEWLRAAHPSCRWSWTGCGCARSGPLRACRCIL